MEFKPVLPKGNVNVSHNAPVKEFLLLFSGITIFLLLAYLVLGLLIDVAVNYISPQLEQKIFTTVTFSNGAPLEKSEKQQALQLLVNELQQCTELPYPLQIHLVSSKQPNAFAAPGGKIVVFSSLIDSVQSENGLAFVLAHELAHFQNRDHLRGMGRAIVFTALVSAITGAGSDLTQMVTPVNQLSQAQYSQHRETLADEQALAILNCHYGHVAGAAEFFETMASKVETQNRTATVTHYFSSHPEAEHRIANLKHLAAQHHLDQRAVTPLDSLFRK